MKNFSSDPPESTESYAELPNNSATYHIHGVVLAGGLSSRLGHDKAALRLENGHSTDLLGSTVRLLEKVTQKVVVIGRDHPSHISIPDIIPGCGPVGGIASALHALKHPCLVLSCDLPFMNNNILEHLITKRERRPEGTLMTAYQQQETGHTEALVAIYEPEAFPFFMKCTEERLLKVSLVIPAEQQYLIPYSASDSLPFFNINYPADLEVVRRILSIISPG